MLLKLAWHLGASRRERLARRYDAIADRSSQLLKIYEGVADLPISVAIRPEVEARILELLAAERTARTLAARIRSGT